MRDVRKTNGIIPSRVWLVLRFAAAPYCTANGDSN
jgi:hypothetical protein